MFLHTGHLATPRKGTKTIVWAVWRILKSSLFTLSIILINHKVSSASLKRHLPRSVAGSKALRKWRILEKSCIQRRRWLPKFSSSLLPFYLWCKLKLILCTTEIFFGDCTCVSTTNIMSCNKESIFPFQPNRRTFWTRCEYCQGVRKVRGANNCYKSYAIHSSWIC